MQNGLDEKRVKFVYDITHNKLIDREKEEQDRVLQSIKAELQRAYQRVY